MTNDSPQRILISGGWGYGNLGDDAILVATIRAVHKLYPAAVLSIMSYNVQETRRVVNDSMIEVVPSVHRELVGDYSDRLFQPLSGNHKLVSHLSQKVNKLKICKVLFVWDVISGLSKSTMDEFKKADLFLQSGGGYFNGYWLDSAIAHTLEIQIAKDLDKKVVIFGQSIGPLRFKRLIQRTGNALRGADAVTVRDSETLEELDGYGIKAELVPDLAIWDIPKRQTVHKRNICVVVNETLSPDNGRVIADTLINIKKFVDKSVDVLISRAWKSDLSVAGDINEYFIKRGIDSKLVIPTSWDQLQEHLSRGLFVVSQNLHSLVLAWRAGVPGIALSDHKKIRAFMDQSNQSERTISPSKLSESLLTKVMKDIIQNTQTIDPTFLAEEVFRGFRETLQKGLRA